MKRLLLLVCCLCSTSFVFAIDNMTLKLGSITGTGWQTEEVVIEWHWLKDNQVALKLNIATLILAELKKPLENVILTCKQAQYDIEQIICAQAKLLIGGDLLDKPSMNLSFSYHFDSQKVDFDLEELALAEGKIDLQAKSAQKGWQVQLNAHKIELDKLLTQISQFIDLPVSFNLGAHFSHLEIKVFGDSEVRRVSIDGEATGLKFSNTEETQVGENLALKVALKTDIIYPLPVSSKNKIKKNQQSLEQDKKYSIQGTLKINQGEVYIEPVYVEIKDKPISMVVDLVWQPTHLNVHHFAYTHTDVINLQGTGEFGMGEKWDIKTLSVQLTQSSLKPFYISYLQSMFDEDSQLNRLDISGAIKAKFDWHKNQHLIAQLYDVNIEDSKKNFGLNGLRGKMQWHSTATDLPSHLHWEGAYLTPALKLPASQIRINFNDHRIKLLAPWYQPIFDGAIRIEQFEWEDLGKENQAWQLQGQLYPISLSELSTPLEWPPLSGQLSGQIPNVSYRDKHLEIGGKLGVRVFDGDIVLHSLSLDNPFGELPELRANIEVNQLNLKTLTEALEFGEIQGQLSGYVNQLYLVDWQPVSFDAYFGTPKDDKMPHKISQKAINNLSNLGGSAAVNAISKSVLRFFEHFYYQRIGWGCHLETYLVENGLEKKVCQMRGAGTASNGYYIIKGSLLPRIDIIGYEKSVNWNVLISRIQTVISATGSINAPMIK